MVSKEVLPSELEEALCEVAAKHQLQNQDFGSSLFATGNNESLPSELEKDIAAVAAKHHDQEFISSFYQSTQPRVHCLHNPENKFGHPIAIASTERSPQGEIDVVVEEGDDGYVHRAEANLGGSGLTMAIKSFDCVPEEAILVCKELIQRMLLDTPFHIKQRIVDNDVHVGVIGHEQVTTDLPPYAWLRQSSTCDGRNWDTETRGLGGTKTCPCCSIAEENLLMYESDRYDQESIMVHEFSHTIMDCGFDDSLRLQLQEVFDWCQARPAQFDGSQYWMSNTREFWAELSQGWFHASIRSDVNNGINTRDSVISQIPPAAKLMREVYGSNDWLYVDNCPHAEKWRR